MPRAVPFFICSVAKETQMTPNEIGDAIRAFRSPTCPACGGSKELRTDPFCDSCLARLPSDLLERVTTRETYLEGYTPAFEYLRSNSHGRR
jgi:hypothetical protein